MKPVISLSRARKERARAARREAADANALRFGRSAAQKAREEARAARDRRALDGHARDTEDGSGPARE